MPKPNPMREQPLRAMVACTNPDTTTVRLSLFNKELTTRMGGPCHKLNAKAFVEDWNAHFDREWNNVRAVAAMMMESVIKELIINGVSPSRIEAAVAKVCDDA